jgi:hypothetical protein
MRSPEIDMNTHWRLAVMFDGRYDLASLEADLRRTTKRLVEIAGDAHLRMGVADMHSDLDFLRTQDGIKRRTVDAAVEVTVANSRTEELPRIAGLLRDPIANVAADSSVEIMAGPVFSIVPARDGEVFLSLAFQRYPGTTSEQFRTWWLHQHSKVATPVLGDDLLAYDQVHVDPQTTAQAAIEFGTAPTHYDAYDNLTWVNRAGFLHSISDKTEMERVYADEVGRIDGSTQRAALMRRF